MKILNYTNWSSENIECVFRAAALHCQVPTEHMEKLTIIVKNGRPSCWWLHNKLQLRLPSNESATPLQAIAVNRLLGDMEYISLLKDISKFFGVSGLLAPEGIFLANRNILNNEVPEWARDLPLTKRALASKEWARDRVSSVEEDLITVSTTIAEVRAGFEKKMETLIKKQARLERQLTRLAKKLNTE